MGLFKTVKKNAKRALSKHWGRAIMVLLLTVLPSVLINMLEYIIRTVSGLQSFTDIAATPRNSFDDIPNLAIASLVVSLAIAILMYVITTPLQQGAARWFFRRTGGESERVSEMFYYFETKRDFFGALWLRFKIGLRVLLWALLLMIPYFGGAGYIAWLEWRRVKLEPGIRFMGGLLMLIWVILALVILAIISNKYFLAPYLYADNPKMRTGHAIRSSIRMTKGYKGSIFTFSLSFIGWFLPSVGAALLVFSTMFLSNIFLNIMLMNGVLVLMVVQLGVCVYLLPYLHMSHALYARYLIETVGNHAHPDRTREYDTHNPIALEDSSREQI